MYLFCWNVVSNPGKNVFSTRGMLMFSTILQPMARFPTIHFFPLNHAMCDSGGW